MNELHLSTLNEIASKSEQKVLLLDKCGANVAESKKLGWRCEYQTSNAYDLKAVQAQSQFCLVAKTERLFQLNLIETLATNCIPVIYADNTILPFAEVRFDSAVCSKIIFGFPSVLLFVFFFIHFQIIDWSLAVINLREADLPSIDLKLKSVSLEKIDELQLHRKWL